MANVQTLRKWSRQMDQYYKTVTKKQLISDSKKAGIVLVSVSAKRVRKNRKRRG